MGNEGELVRLGPPVVPPRARSRPGPVSRSQPASDDVFVSTSKGEVESEVNRVNSGNQDARLSPSGKDQGGKIEDQCSGLNAATRRLASSSSPSSSQPATARSSSGNSVTAVREPATHSQHTTTASDLNLDERKHSLTSSSGSHTSDTYSTVGHTIGTMLQPSKAIRSSISPPAGRPRSSLDRQPGQLQRNGSSGQELPQGYATGYPISIDRVEVNQNSNRSSVEMLDAYSTTSIAQSRNESVDSQTSLPERFSPTIKPDFLGGRLSPYTVDTDLSRTTTTQSDKSEPSSSKPSFFKRPHSLLPTLSSLSISSQISKKGSTQSAGGYVNARMARQEEREAELEQRREKEKEFEREKEKAMKDKGVTSKDIFKVVDGVEKKSSSSGVYTPATFPGVSGKPKSSLPGVYTPPGFVEVDGSGLKTPDIQVSPDLSEQYSPLSRFSPHKVGPFSPQLMRKKSAALGGMLSPSFSGMKAAVTDTWRRSSAESPSWSQPPNSDDGRIRQQTSPGFQNTSYSSGLSSWSNTGHDAPGASRMRSVSDQTYEARAVEGMGLGLGEPIASTIPKPRMASNLDSPLRSSAQEETYFGTRLATSTPDSPTAKSRNVKNLSLPLSDLHGLKSPDFDTLTPTEQSTPGSVGTAAKGVRRKPVPQC